MFELNYYFVDVGDNSREISQRKVDIALKDALSNEREDRTSFSRKFIRHRLKEMVTPYSDEYKFVAVNKVGKISVNSQVENLMGERVREPFFTCDTVDIHKIYPTERLYVRCCVIKNNYENVLLDYNYIIDPLAKQNKVRRKTL